MVKTYFKSGEDPSFTFDFHGSCHSLLRSPSRGLVGKFLSISSLGHSIELQ